MTHSRPIASGGETLQRKALFHLNVSKDFGLTGGAHGGAHSEGTFPRVLFTYYLTPMVSGPSRSRAFSRVLSPFTRHPSNRPHCRLWGQGFQRPNFSSGYFLPSFFPWMPRTKKGGSLRRFHRAMGTFPLSSTNLKIPSGIQLNASSFYEAFPDRLTSSLGTFLSPKFTPNT